MEDPPESRQHRPAPAAAASADPAATHRRHLRWLWAVPLVVGPGMLGMLGENDGPSMLSYAATGADYGVGFFLPFIVLTFAAAAFVQIVALRVGSVARQGLAPLIFQRFGSFWGAVSCADLLVINVITLVTEVTSIRVGLSYFGEPPWSAVAAAAVLVGATSLSGNFERWERIALGLGAFNLVFVPTAVLANPDPAAVGHAFGAWQPLPGGGTPQMLLLLASDAGATLTPWMLYFELSATTDRRAGSGRRPTLGGMRADAILGGCVAAVAACATVIAAAPLAAHHVTVRAGGGAAYAQALQPFLGRWGASLFAVGLVEAGGLALLTIAASTAYVVEGALTGGAAGFSASRPRSRAFRLGMVVLTVAAGLVTLIPHAPLLAIVLNANIVSVVLIPPALIFLLLLATDTDVMGERTVGRGSAMTGAAVTVVIFVAVAAYVGVAFVKALP